MFTWWNLRFLPARSGHCRDLQADIRYIQPSPCTVSKALMSPITPQLFEFLSELSDNNRRDWFKAHKGRYDAEVLNPAVELVSQFVKPLAKLAPLLVASPKRHGGSVMRIYKDTRFSRDKTPYKTSVGISFRHEADGTIHAPGVYLHLDPHASFLGVGCWRPERTALAAIRSAIKEQPQAWNRVVNGKRFREKYELAGDSLKTAPRGIPRDHPQIHDLRRIDFIGTAPLEISEICDPNFIGDLQAQVAAAKPFMMFLCDALDVPY
jgi:uncharacterized protein (TIGR02453 family)